MGVLHLPLSEMMRPEARCSLERATAVRQICVLQDGMTPEMAAYARQVGIVALAIHAATTTRWPLA